MRYEGIFVEPVDRIGGEPIRSRMARKAPLRHLDPSLLLVTMLLSAFGAVMVYSVTSLHAAELGLDENAVVTRQLAYMIAGLIALVGMCSFDYRHLRSLAPVLYAVTIITLVLVLTPLGDIKGGASRWIDFGVFQAQPSELAKLVVVICVSAFLSERKGDIRGIDIVLSVLIVAVPMTLIYLEPDLGTMMVFIALTGALFLIAGAKIRHFVALGLVGIVGLIAVFELGVLQDYQVERLTSFLDPTPNVRSEGYNLIQSQIAIGSGGMRGKGLQKENTQTALDYVPEQHTDFIFTAVGEQLGFFGCAALLGMFGFLIWRAIRISTISRDAFGTLLAAGIAAFWAFQIFVNVGMTMGIMPITGIPLPFISFGGSSLITNFMAVGLLHNIHMRRFL
jgi:rod shape determining protein RodA